VTEIVFTDAAIDDLRRIGPDAVPKVLKKILLLEENAEAGYPLGGELTGYRKLVVGRNTWRVVYRVTEAKAVEICEVWAIGPRADAEIYAEAVTRVGVGAESRPEFASLADVLERLGRAAAGVSVASPVHVEPVPDWLAKRLIHSAGMAREDVAAMDLQAAVDAWTNFMSKPPQEP
jgi:mRNA interferase RelE/StbE